MISTSLFDDGPEIEFPTEIMCSQFHPTIPNLFLSGAISGHLHWFAKNFCFSFSKYIFYHSSIG
jgi:hypothetical protein